MLSLVPKPMLCQQHWWMDPSSSLIIFFFWCFFPKSLLLTFRSGVSLKSWHLVLLPSRLLNLTFLDSTFGYLSLCHFSQVSWFIPARLKVSQPLPFMVLFSRFPEVPAACSWIVGSQAFWFLFASLGGW